MERRFPSILFTVVAPEEPERGFGEDREGTALRSERFYRNNGDVQPTLKTRAINTAESYEKVDGNVVLLYIPVVEKKVAMTHHYIP